MSDRAFIACGKDADLILRILAVSGKMDLSTRLRQQGLTRGDLTELLADIKDNRYDPPVRARDAVANAIGDVCGLARVV